jgi:hypothetical protein
MVVLVLLVKEPKRQTSHILFQYLHRSLKKVMRVSTMTHLISKDLAKI